MEDQGTGAAQAPGWDPDPYGRHEQRYWDGAGWTDQVRDQGVTGRDASEQQSPWSAMAAVRAAAPESVAAPASRASLPPAPTAPRPAAAPTPSPTPPPAPAAPIGAPPTPAALAWDAPITLAPTAMPPAAPTMPPPTSPLGAPPVAPPPAWGPPPGTVVPPRPPIGAYPDPTPMPARGRRPRWWMVAAISLAVIVGGGYFVFRPPPRIDAGPPAATPAGFRVVDGEDYRFAAPDSWVARVVTSEDQERIKDSLEGQAPGIGDRIDESDAQMDGAMTLAADPVTRDNVTVLRNHWMRGDPSDPDTLRDIEVGVDDDMPGYTISGMSAAPADVHGFPAATLTYAATLGSVTVHQVMTIIQTGDHVFQVTVTSLSPGRATELSGQIVPTFDPA